MAYKSALDRTCEKHGCAKVCLDPKLHEFDECFDYGIRFGDIDGSVERKGHILWMEWKIHFNDETWQNDHKAQLLQAIAFTTNSPKQTFVFVEGDPIKMDVRRVCIIKNGEVSDWYYTSPGSYKKFLRQWFERADGRTKAGEVA